MIDLNGLESSWREVLSDEFNKPYFKKLNQCYSNVNARVCPPKEKIFAAFNLCPFWHIKAVILAQDPYHGICGDILQANGLAFSVELGLALPPSLKNIFKEIKRDLGFEPPNHGDLSAWAKEGVLLLNCILSVELNKPLSHRKFGWEMFSDAVIRALCAKKQHLVFMLWGNYAKNKKYLINENNHLILSAPHPSPLARGFIGCGHFGICNDYLKKNNIKPINWRLDSA